uniref:Rho GTPase activating protein 25 n=1 Tax=Cavia porcellus TaxID=10141 RepID=H0VYE9_CAVPO
MSLKLPRNWDFNLKAEAAKIARSRSVMTGEQMANLHSSSTPNPLERPIKMGWLKKQRSIVKNWQQRYFVLKTRQLYYYKDEEDSKPQGSMYLPGSTIKEIATNPEEAGKFVFEVIPASWDLSRTAQDSYVLMASSQAEMEEWVKFLRRVAGTPSGAVFGQRLDETVAYEQKFGPHLVPILVEKCAEFILEHGMNEEGIFRLPGQDNLVKQLRDAFDAGERPSFDRDTDVHTVASLLKLYLRDLPEPVVPWSQYEGFLLCGQLMNADEAKTPQIQRVMTMMIRDHEVLFPKSKDIPLSPPAQKNDPKKPPVPRSSVGWDATEDPSISKTDNFSNVTSDSNATSPSGSQPSDRPQDDSSNASREKPGDWKLQSRKRTQTLPNRKCFLTSAFPNTNSNRVEIFKNEFWSPSSEAKAGEGHRRTMSQDLHHLSDSQRTSTYDNVPTQPGSHGCEGGTLSSPTSDSKRDAFASTDSETGPAEEVLDSLQKTVQDLRMQIETQKKTYEEQIKNLEKENYDVWAKVVKLNEELEKEKKKFAALEISLRNVERSREDVERRNRVLEEEVKEFVKSMKEPKTDP